MNCMKCGREIEAGQVFCEACLEEMEQYPVRPGVAIQLPNRGGEAARKPAPRKRTPTPEEQVVQLKRWVRGLAVCLVMAILSLILAVVAASLVIDDLELKQLIGRNYSTVVTPKETEPPQTTEGA